MNVAIYMRLSKEDEFIREESNSISMQRILLRDYVLEHFPDADIQEFVDDGYTGTNFDRPGVQALLDSVKNFEINCIVVKDFSRFARDYIELGSYLEQIFPFMGVRFISINDKYDSLTYQGNVSDIDVNFKNLLYDLYSKDLSVKVKASMRSLKEQGKVVMSAPAFGYKKDPDDRHKVLIAEDEAVIVRRIFSMFASGVSSVEIAKIFNEEGVKTPAQVQMEKGIRKITPKGGNFIWQHSSILRMLKNRMYAGDLVQGVYECQKIRDCKKRTDPEKWIIIENHHEAIIDRETFDKVQALLGRKSLPWRRKDEHVLVGRVVCGRCGRTLRHSTTGHHYYWCPGLNIYNLDGCLKRAEDFYLEEVILYRLQQHILELGETDKLLMNEKKAAEDALECLRMELKKIKQSIDKEKQNRMKLFEDYALGKVSSYNSSDDVIKELDDRRNQLIEEIASVESKVREYGRVKIRDAYAVLKLTPELLDEYVKEIQVFSEDDIRVIWK